MGTIGPQRDELVAAELSLQLESRYFDELLKLPRTEAESMLWRLLARIRTVHEVTPSNESERDTSDRVTEVDKSEKQTPKVAVVSKNKVAKSSRKSRIKYSEQKERPVNVIVTRAIRRSAEPLRKRDLIVAVHRVRPDVSEEYINSEVWRMKKKGHLQLVKTASGDLAYDLTTGGATK